jgi:hypothetical protein
MRRNNLSIILAISAFVLIQSPLQSMENIDDQPWNQFQEPPNHMFIFADIHKINLANLHNDLRRCEAVRRQFENDQTQDRPDPVE